MVGRDHPKEGHEGAAKHQWTPALCFMEHMERKE
jgi:hypothetical protein